MSRASSRTVVVLPDSAAPLRMRRRWRRCPAMTSCSHLRTSATLCTASSSRFRGPKRSAQGRRSSSSASEAGGLGGLRNRWLAPGGSVAGAGSAAVLRRFRACWPTTLDEAALSSETSSSEMGSLAMSSTGALRLSGALAARWACFEKSVLRSAVRAFCSSLALSPPFCGRALRALVGEAAVDGAALALTGLADAVATQLLAGELGDETR